LFGFFLFAILISNTINIIGGIQLDSLTKSNTLLYNHSNQVLATYFDNILNDYSHTEQKYLIKNKSSILMRILKIINTALLNAPSKKNHPSITNSDMIFFGDVHGQLDLLVQNLYIAGIVDKNGNYMSSTNKSFFQLGDAIYKGPYQLETFLYLRILKKQADFAGKKIILLLGNHELNSLLNKPSTVEESIITSILKEDILTNRAVASYGHPTKNLMAFHGGLEKLVLVNILTSMCDDSTYSNKLRFYKNKLLLIQKALITKSTLKKDNVHNMYLSKLYSNTSSKEIYKIIHSCDISFSDISSWINTKFKEFLITTNKKEDFKYSFLFTTPGNIFKSKKKAQNVSTPLRGKNSVSDFIIKNAELKYIYKSVQVVGHKNTASSVNNGHGKKGGIMQNKATIFTDTGLVEYNGGNQGFLAINSSTGNFYAIEIDKPSKTLPNYDEKDIGLSLTSKISHLKVRQLPGIKLQNTNYFLKQQFFSKNCL
jgi:hypothetical protein